MDTYEKKYNEALERAKDFKNGIVQFALEPGESIVHYIFPELRESEDERVIKTLYHLVKDHDWLNGATKEEVLTYLEKQKDCILVPKSHLDPPGEDGEDGMKILEMQKEHKPNIELIKRSWYMAGYNDRKFGNEPKWIVKTGKSGPKHELNPKYGQPLADEQKPAEWSEEDEKMVRFYEDDYDNNLGNMPMRDVIENRIKFKDWLLKRLKSLRPSWKPSEEQMDALDMCVDYLDESDNEDAGIIESLYEQLKSIY